MPPRVARSGGPLEPGRWVAAGWTTAGELCLAATLTSGQCFRWRRRALTGTELDAIPGKGTSSDAGQARGEGWVGTIGTHVLELATVAPGAGPFPQRLVSSTFADAAAPPVLSERQRRLGGSQLLLLARRWNADPTPLLASVGDAAWPFRDSAAPPPAAALTRPLATVDDLALLARRYLRLDDDCLAAWDVEWLPAGWETRQAPCLLAAALAATPPPTPPRGSGAGKKITKPPATPTRKGMSKAERDQRLARALPRDNTALRRRLAENAVAVQQHLAEGGAFLAAAEAASEPKSAPATSAKRSKRAEVTTPRPYGVRLLRQDPYETLLGFLCSQNNHQRRIAAMVGAMCAKFGDRPRLAPGAAIPREWVDAGVVHAMPTAQQLHARASDAALRELGFGYRAKYIVGTAAAMLGDGAPGHVLPPATRKALPDHGFSLAVSRMPELAQQRDALMALPGVGRKVADCILLFAYDQLAVTPIDTHMAQITSLASAASWADAAKPAKGKAKKATTAKGAANPEQEDATLTLTPRVHDAFQQHYAHVFGPWAGWAHCFLFAPRLTTSSVTLTASDKR